MNLGTLRGIPGKRIGRVSDASRVLSGAGDFVQETAVLYGVVPLGASPSNAVGSDGDLFRSTGLHGSGGGREFRKVTGAWILVGPYTNAREQATLSGKNWTTPLISNFADENGAVRIGAPANLTEWGAVLQTVTAATCPSAGKLVLNGDTLASTWAGVRGINLSINVLALPPSGQTLNFGAGVNFGNPSPYVSITPAGVATVRQFGVLAYTFPVSLAAGDNITIIAFGGATLIAHTDTTQLQRGFTFYASEYTSLNYWRAYGAMIKVWGQGTVQWMTSEVIPF